jgi:hypothetical protein
MSIFEFHARAPSTSRSGVIVSLAVFTVGCAQPTESGDGERALGAPRDLGQGSIAAYAEFANDGAPQAIGVVLSGNVLNTLPEEHSDMHQCFDADGNDSIDVMSECSHWHEFVLPLPSQASRRSDIPFKWALFNWNPAGHIPPGVWDVPHFDVHFYMEPIENIFALKRGPCGPEFLQCDQFEVATKPVPANYIHPDFEDVGAAAPGMGNHLIDQSMPEFHGEPFKRHWIFGVYDGRIIFYEEMVARSFLLTEPDTCNAIKSPEGVAVTGFYPTNSCIRYDSESGEYTISMEDFVRREASPPRL